VAKENGYDDSQAGENGEASEDDLCSDKQREADGLFLSSDFSEIAYYADDGSV
jgi:hypothetical protein